MTETDALQKKLFYLGNDLVGEILGNGVIKTVPAGTLLVSDGQYIKFIPIVLSGLVKVFTQMEEKELLLYYIQPEQSCIMSFSSCLNNDKSRISALTEEESTVLLIPSDKVARWVTEYPKINLLFYQQYDLRYTELLGTIHSLLYKRLDKRLLEYLMEKVTVTGKNPVKISHKEVANDLGT
jgi:CRP/FNR family transcriptional regulator